MVEKTVFGTLPSGERAHVYTLENGGVTVRVSDFGATLLGIDVPDARGEVADVVLGFADLAGYAGVNDAFYGATVAPVANRTAGAEVEVAGTVYHLIKNDSEVNNLHTDKVHGLHKRVWRAEASEDGEGGAKRVAFEIDIADGDFGLPGNRRVSAAYELSADGELTLSYRMDTDAPTFANITNHGYFNLAGHASGSVEGQLVQIDAERFVPIDGTSIPTGELRQVAGTPFDFRAPHAIGERIAVDDEQLKNARGYDHCFCVDGYEPDAAPRHALHAEDPASGRALDVYVTTPGIQLYTGNWLDDPDAKDGAAYTARSGFAVEPEFYPDCAHHAAWPQPVCTPDHPFTSTIRYRFSTVSE